MAAASPLLVLRGIGKSYAAPVPVLDGVDLAIAPGEVHALLGANGAGKTTLARIVAGLTRAGHGRMELQGREYAPVNKAEAERQGVQIVQQELALIANLSVAENLFFSRLPRRAGFIRHRELEARARVALARVGLRDLSPETPVGELGIGAQQLVEIAAAFARKCNLLILDEPTAALTDPQAQALFDNIRTIAREGCAVLYISHRLDELRDIADRATVLRDGGVVLTESLSRLTRDEIVRAMVGRDVDVALESGPGPRRSGDVALRVEGLAAGRHVRGVSFTVHRGEVFGLAGLVGAGRTTLLRAIFGADPPRAGGIALGPTDPLRRFRHPRESVRMGLAMIPEDRKRDGLLLPLSVRRNAVLGILRRLAGWACLLRREREDEAARPVLDRLEVQRTGMDQPVRELSGGNQQKVVIARWLLGTADVLLFDEPTRGIDVSARAAIHRLLSGLAHRGKAVVVASSDLDELMSICDRIGVLSAGRLVQVLERGAWSRGEITRAAFHEHLG
jgi:ribose transport system ATP-binding protein